MKRLLIFILILSTILIVGCNSSGSNPDYDIYSFTAEESLRTYLECFNTNDIVMVQDFSEVVVLADELGNVSLLKINSVSEIGDKDRISFHKNEAKKQREIDDVRIFDVEYYIKFNQGISADGDYEATYYLYQTTEGNWIVYGKETD